MPLGIEGNVYSSRVWKGVFMLIDRFDRRFTYLRLSLLERCNFRCNYCLPEGNDCETTSANDLTLPEMRRLLTAFAMLGTEKIRLTGGEPALRSDLPEIIRQAKSIPGIKKVALTTNGFNLQKKLSTWVDAGLDAINISVDSLDASVFTQITGANRLQYILDGIDQALEYSHLQVKVNAVLLRQYNANSLPAYLRYIKERNLTLRFIELMRTNDNVDFYRQQHLSGALIQKRLLQEGWQRIERDLSAGPALEYKHPDYQGRIGLIMPYSKNFCASCNRLRVSSAAELFLCLFTDDARNFRHLLQQDDPRPVMEFLQDAIMDKKETHYLEQQFSGNTRHLAMIGG